MSKEKKDLVKIVVLKPFRDKTDTNVRFEVGTELEFDAERADDVVTRELAEIVDPIG